VVAGWNASAHSADAPSHTSSRSHSPRDGLHTLPAARIASGGQAAAAPSHVSSASHAPAALRHGMRAGTFTSPGHPADAPSQTSAKSHGPADGRHVVPDATGAQTPSATPVIACVHAWQSLAPPPHAELQHTPSTQNPLAHSAAAAHACVGP
jgi:hypothetical protein